MRHTATLTSGSLTHRILLTAHTRTESTNDRYRDMMMQKTMTTVVDPTVSARVGNDTFFNSPRTSLKNSRIESVNFLNIRTSPSLLIERERASPHPVQPPRSQSSRPY